MKAFMKVINSSLLLFLTISSCSDISGSASSTITDQNKKDSIVVTDSLIATKEVTLTNKQEKHLYEFHTKAGYTYEINIIDDYKQSIIKKRINMPTGDSLKINQYDKSFKSLFDGIHTVIFYVDSTILSFDKSIIPPYKFTFTITEHPPISDQIEGKWILTHTKLTAGNTSIEKYYSESNAYEFISINNESIIEFDKFYKDTSLFVDNWRNRLEWKIESNKLIFYGSNNYGSALFEYQKFEADQSTIIWAIDNFKGDVNNAEFIGSWYVIADSMYEIEGIDNLKMFEDISYRKYSSLEKSNSLKTITSDSMSGYYRMKNFVTNSYKSANNIKADSYGYSDDVFVENGNLIFKSIGFEFDKTTKEFGYDLFQQTFSKLNSNTIPSSWGKPNILPSNYIDLTLNSEFQGTFPTNDSIWFRISANSGVSYGFEYPQTNVIGFMLDPNVLNGKISTLNIGDPSSFEYASIPFNTQSSGYYYVLLVKTLSSGANAIKVKLTTQS